MAAHDLASSLPSPTRMLSAALVATLVAALAVSSVGTWAVSDSLEQSAAIARREQHTAYLVGSIGWDVSRVRANLLDALTEADPRARVRRARTIARDATARREALPALFGGDERAHWLELQPRLDRTLRRFDRVGRAIEAGRREEAERMLDRSDSDTRRLHEEIDRFQRATMTETESAIADVHHRTAHTLKLVSLAKLGVLAAIAFAWILVLRIVNTQRRAIADQIARLESINRDLEAFAGRVAHDMRNVLTPLQLGTEAIAASDAEQRVRAIAVRMDRSCARGRELVEGLLAFSRAAQTVATAAEARASVAQEIHDVLDQLETTIADADVSVEHRIPADAEVALPRPLLHAVLLNLVDNAVKFMRGRTRRKLSIEARVSPSVVRILVTDTGPGIPETERSRVFEALYRGAARQMDGIGLGLATAKRIAESHRGRIDIRATGPQGTTFVVELPRARAARTETAQSTSTTIKGDATAR